MESFLKLKKCTKDINFLNESVEMKSFTEVFEVLFPDNGYNCNVKTWLKVIEENFVFNDSYVSIEMRSCVLKIFDKAKVVIGTPAAMNSVYGFFLYLAMVYEMLKGIKYTRNDNILKFFEGISFDEIKVVIVAQDPAPGCDSSGYAFHNSKCAATKFILQRACEETNSALDTKLTEMAVKNFVDKCDMSEWIAQGVLLINSYLTYHEDSRFEFHKAWEYFTDFVVKSLNSEKKNIVFILIGIDAGKKDRLINKDNHSVISLPYPTNKKGRIDQIKSKWQDRRPFTEANKYLPDGKIINWVQKPSSSEDNLTKLFETRMTITQKPSAL